MNKNQILKQIAQMYQGKRAFFKAYDTSFIHDEKEYFVKILPATSKTIVTVNSTIIWEIKKGTPSGLRFRTSSKHLFDLRDFMKYQHKIIIFHEKPYKILKALNESDLADISSDNFVHNVHYFSDSNHIKSILY